MGCVGGESLELEQECGGSPLEPRRGGKTKAKSGNPEASRNIRHHQKCAQLDEGVAKVLLVTLKTFQQRKDCVVGLYSPVNSQLLYKQPKQSPYNLCRAYQLLKNKLIWSYLQSCFHSCPRNPHCMNGWGLAPSLQVMQSLSKVTDRPSGESVRENSIYQGNARSQPSASTTQIHKTLQSKRNQNPFNSSKRQGSVPLNLRTSGLGRKRRPTFRTLAVQPGLLLFCRNGLSRYTVSAVSAQRPQGKIWPVSRRFWS